MVLFLGRSGIEEIQVQAKLNGGEEIQRLGECYNIKSR
jgi:hypothetical protein